MADLSFGQQLVLSAAQGLVAAAAVVIAGWKYFRHQERIRREEDSLGELAKLRHSTLTKCAEMVGEYAFKRLKLLMVEKAVAGNERLPAEAVEAHRAEAGEHYLSTSAYLFSRQHLLPRGALRSFLDALHEVREMKEPLEVNGPLDRLSRELDRYLPDLPVREAAP